MPVSQTNLPQGAPIVSLAPGSNGVPTSVWLQFFLTLFNRTGGATGSPSLILDTISDAVGAMLIRASTAWEGLLPGSQYQVLRMGAALPEWDVLDGNSFVAQSVKSFFAGPQVGVSAKPTFRFIAYTDLPQGEYPGTNSNDNAIAGNVGEYLSTTVPSGSAVALATTQISDIATLSLSAGDWDVWGSLATNAALTSASGWISSSSGTDPTPPNSGAYATWGSQSTCIPIGSSRFSLANPTTIYLSIKPTFAGSASAYGFLGARRRR